jgi:hypothetical protein
VLSWSKTRLIRTRITQCVHYCAFRYGRNEYNPYESYVVDIFRNTPRANARERFIAFLRHYRPRHLGEALGLRDTLSRRYPLWAFPWADVTPIDPQKQYGWSDDPNDCPDILTHFSEVGIPLSRIEEEFFWLERALDSISEKGYRPLRYRNFVTALRLVRSDGENAFLLTDGNHRVAAMAALGYKNILIRQPSRYRVNEADCDRWPGVRSGLYGQEDALRVFGAYFSGNFDYHTAVHPARIINTDISPSAVAQSCDRNSNPPGI